jgi:archaellum component FlaD/FlaE
MHENDHLNGVLFIDRVEAKDKREIAADLERLKKHYKLPNEHLKIWGGQ